MIANAALVDIDVAGYAVSNIVEDEVGDAKVADFEGGGGDRIANGAVRDVGSAWSAGVGSA